MSVNLAATTREMWDTTLEDEVLLALPLVAMMIEHEVLSVSGTKLKQSITVADAESLAQDYEANDPLTGGEKTVLGTAEWLFKKFQLPVTYDCDTEIENQDASKVEAPIDEVEATVTAAQDGARRHLNTLLYGAAADAGKKTFQGLRSALTHDVQYGGITRTIGSALGTYWQGGSMADTYTDQAIAISPSIANVRKAAQICGRHAKGNQKLYAFCGETIYSSLRSQYEARMLYTRDGSKLQKFGFETFVDGKVEFVCDSWLTITGATTAKYFFLLDPESWELRIKPKRNFRLTPFVWQGAQNNGLDRYLARILVAGNCICRHPNQNLFLSNMA